MDNSLPESFLTCIFEEEKKSYKEVFKQEK